MIITLWCLFAFFHLGVTISLAAAFRRYRQRNNHKKPSMSVIVAARNEEKNLKILIPLIQNQAYENFEIVLALDRTSDSSATYIQNLDDDKIKVINIKDVKEGWNPKKYALKSAIENATGEWLIFTDADCQPSSNTWLRSITNQISNQTDIIIGISPYKSYSSLLSKFIQFEAFMTAFTYAGRTLSGKPYMAVGRNMAIRKSFFIESNGYDDIHSIQGGDDDLFIQKNASKENTRILLGAESVVFTEPERSWKDYWNQKVRHLSVSSYYKKADQFLLGLNHFSHLIFIVMLFYCTTHSFFLPMLLFYLFIKLVSYRFASSKMEININYILLPLVDIIYAVSIPVIGLWSKLEKDIKWKN